MKKARKGLVFVYVFLNKLFLLSLNDDAKKTYVINRKLSSGSTEYKKVGLAESRGTSIN